MSQPQDQNGLQISRDTAADPIDGYEAVPLWLISIFGAFLLWGGWYLGTYNAGWRPYELDESAGFGAGPATQAVEDPLVLGKRLFAGNCVSCHQADGKGLPGQYPTLNGSEWVLGNPAWMKRIVLNGLEGPITVAGASYNNAMPGHAAKLTDRQIAAVISYVRTNADWGNNAQPVTPESVAATRAAVKGRTAPWTADELKAITADEQAAAPATQTGAQPTPAPATQAGAQLAPAPAGTQPAAPASSPPTAPAPAPAAPGG